VPRRSNFSKWKHATVVILFFFYGRIPMNIVEVFVTTNEKIHGSYWLVSDYSMSTSSPDYPAVVALAVATTVLFVCLLPIVVVWLIWRNRAELDKPRTKPTPFALTYGWLYCGYRTKPFGCAVYEVVIAVRKVAWIALLAWFQSDPFWQLMAAELFLLAWIAVQVSVQPFEEKWANRLELGTLVSILISVMLSFPDIVHKHGDSWTQFVCFFTIVAVNLLMSGILLVLMLYALQQHIVQELRRRGFTSAGTGRSMDADDPTFEVSDTRDVVNPLNLHKAPKDVEMSITLRGADV
jgi:hypothetical protein